MYFDVNETLLTDYIIWLYTTDGENNLYYHDAELANGAEAKGYRYSGPIPITMFASKQMMMYVRR